jgi:hypothetical protein
MLPVGATGIEEDCCMGYPAVVILTVFHCFFRRWDLYLFSDISANDVCFNYTSSFSCAVIFPSTGFLSSSVCAVFMFLDVIHCPFFPNHNVSETGFCLRLQAKPTQSDPIDRASPYLQTSVPTPDRVYMPSTAQTICES